MSQPSRSLLWATDASYPAGSDPWSSGPTKVALTTGEIAAGFVPNTQVPAEKINDLFSLLTSYVDSIADAPALTWDRLANTKDTGQPNGNNWNETGIPIGSRFVGIAPGVLYSNVDAEVLVQLDSTLLFYSEDGYTWVSKGANGILGGNPRGLAIGVRPDGNTISIVAWDQSNNGVVRATDNLGTSWYTAGSLAASFEGNVSFGGAHPTTGRFFICSRSQLYYQDDLASNTPWTRIDTASLGWNGAPPQSPTCFETSPTESVIGISGLPSCIHSSDGDTWAASSFAANPGDGIKAIHWSASHEKWIALSYNNGRILTAPAGFASWTECPQMRIPT